VLPVPTTRTRFPCWHTIGSVFGWAYHRKLLQKTLAENPYYHYVVHPADLIDDDDVDRSFQTRFEKRKNPLAERTKIFSECMATIGASREIVPLKKMRDHLVSLPTLPA
jgi:hypothetical protein